MRRCHWSDRLGGIDKDLAAMEGKLQTPPTPAAPTGDCCEELAGFEISAERKKERTSPTKAVERVVTCGTCGQENRGRASWRSRLPKEGCRACRTGRTKFSIAGNPCPECEHGRPRSAP
jgi:hypothetical protein